MHLLLLVIRRPPSITRSPYTTLFRSLQPNLPESLLASGWIQLWYVFDWQGAEVAFQRAPELAPGNADVVRANGTVHRSEEHTSEPQSRLHLVCRFLLGNTKA